MIEGLKPYAEYKDSGLPWAPILPAHWSLMPNRAVLRKRKVLVGGNHRNFQLLSLTKGGVIVRDISTGKGKFSSDMGTSQEVRKGDFVFCLFDVPETPRTVGLSTHNGMITSAYTVFESRKLSSEGVRYLERFYLAMDDQKLLSPLYSGLRHTIPPPRFLGTKTPLPPPDEQAAIVRFLDHANRKIDGFIRAKRKLIGLLNEQKQAIIHRAVTRGLNPDVKLKASGIHWLGEIPEHWEARQLRRVCRRIKTGGTPKGADERFFEKGGFNWYTPSDFRDAIELGDASRQLSTLGVNEVTVFPGNTILMIGIGATIGKVSISRKPCSCNQQINAILTNTKLINSVFLAFYLRTLRTYIVDCGKFTTMPIINQDETKRLPVVVPPISEQVEIAIYVEHALKPFSDAIARTEREIALMLEYRTRLTADIVTGKLDVREAAAKLPEVIADEVVEPPADEPIDETETEEGET